MYPAHVAPQAAFVPPPSQNDRMISAACHVSSIVGFTLVAPAVIYFTQRERSGFVARHALQALFLQLVHLATSAVLIGVGILSVLAFFSFTHTSSGDGWGIALSVWAVGIGVLVLTTLIYLVAMIVGVVECLQGKEASLPLIGPLAHSIHKG